jgi:hypothetical protein
VGKLKLYLESTGWAVKFMRDCKSIFQAYNNGVKYFDPGDEDRILLCHDDIEILLREEYFNDVIDRELRRERCGFVGLAGSTTLHENTNWVSSGHKSKAPHGHGGMIWHGKNIEKSEFSFFGNRNQAIQVDGVFMVTTGKVIKNIELRKPKIFEGGWHWYDAYYCLQAHIKGYNNFIMNLPVLHYSEGDYNNLFYTDCINFTKLFGKHLPVVIRKLQK